MHSVRQLESDEWNLEHISKHSVTAAEVEAVRHGNSFGLRASYKNRIVVVGQSDSGRILSIVLGPTPGGPDGSFYVFTARPSDRKEQRTYEHYSKESASG